MTPEKIHRQSRPKIGKETSVPLAPRKVLLALRERRLLTRTSPLPAAGNRNGTSVNNVGSNGNYWSASYNNSNNAWNVNFNDSNLNTDNNNNRYNGFSVRLVAPSENCPIFMWLIMTLAVTSATSLTSCVSRPILKRTWNHFAMLCGTVLTNLCLLIASLLLTQSGARCLPHISAIGLSIIFISTIPLKCSSERLLRTVTVVSRDGERIMA